MLGVPTGFEVLVGCGANTAFVTREGVYIWHNSTTESVLQYIHHYYQYCFTSMYVHEERKQTQPHRTVTVCIYGITSHQMKMVRLEASLAASNSREDHLRGELAETARREGATKERHMRELAEVRQGEIQKGGAR